MQGQGPTPGRRSFPSFPLATPRDQLVWIRRIVAGAFLAVAALALLQGTARADEVPGSATVTPLAAETTDGLDGTLGQLGDAVDQTVDVVDQTADAVDVGSAASGTVNAAVDAVDTLADAVAGTGAPGTTAVAATLHEVTHTASQAVEPVTAALDGTLDRVVGVVRETLDTVAEPVRTVAGAVGLGAAPTGSEADLSEEVPLPGPTAEGPPSVRPQARHGSTDPTRRAAFALVEPIADGRSAEPPTGPIEEPLRLSASLRAGFGRGSVPVEPGPVEPGRTLLLPAIALLAALLLLHPRVGPLPARARTHPRSILLDRSVERPG